MGKPYQCGFVPERWFEPAITCYKVEGETITEDYNIWDSHHMDKNDMYTALSQCKKLSQIHIQFTNKIFYPAVEPHDPTEITFKQSKIGFIYEMYNAKNDVYYIGQTTTSIEQRFNEHLESENDFTKQNHGQWVIKE